MFLMEKKIQTTSKLTMIRLKLLRTVAFQKKKNIITISNQKSITDNNMK